MNAKRFHLDPVAASWAGTTLAMHDPYDFLDDINEQPEHDGYNSKCRTLVEYRHQDASVDD